MSESVRSYWQLNPCGARSTLFAEGSLAFFEEVERQRYSGDDFMFEVAGFDRWQGRRLLEVGCGLGSDLLQFVRNGADACAVDVTERAAALASRRLQLYGFRGKVAVADAQRLPIRSNWFDLVYSWGVIHHTPDPPACASEIIRACKPGGTVLAMVYHRRSLLALQAWIRFGLLRGRPFQGLRQIIAANIESPGTKAYTCREAARLFEGLERLTVRSIVTRYDLRVGRRRFLPRWTRRLVPAGLGWFLVIDGTKPTL